MSESPVANNNPDLRDPVAMAKLSRYTLAARLVVDGLYTGQHKSPRKGFSVEFAEHKPYSPGIDPRHLDWKLLARRERLYIKQYEEQTNLRAYLLLDATRSMHSQHTGPMTKFQYAACCAAALCHLMQRQQDAFGLMTFRDQPDLLIPPRQGSAHLSQILDALEHTEPDGNMALVEAIEELARRVKRRALIIILSDFVGRDANLEMITRSLGQLRHRKHEVIALQILDPAELDFPFRDVGRIRDMETGLSIEADPQAIRDHYRAAIQNHIDTLRRSCLNAAMGYALGRTDQRFDDFLARLLAQREG